MPRFKKILVTGGAGYVGAVLVPKLLDKGYYVKVLDLYMYGDDVLASVKGHKNLREVKGDIRDKALLEKELPGADVVIHLASIPTSSFKHDPALGRSINYDAFTRVVDIAKKSKIKRFIYASSSSVYGAKGNEEATEESSLNPLNEHSKYKAMCERYLASKRAKGFVTMAVRQSIVCGYSPRLRLDLPVNVLISHAIHKERIKVLGGEQKRPHIHIDDLTDLYVKLLEYPDETIDGKVFNVGHENMKMKDIAHLVSRVVSKNFNKKLEVVTVPTDKNHSYHISSKKIEKELGFATRRSVKEAVNDLCRAFREGKMRDSMYDRKYYGAKTIPSLKNL
jgi:nucleoside-diphosphate-sugar epimerase